MSSFSWYVKWRDHRGHFPKWKKRWEEPGQHIRPYTLEVSQPPFMRLMESAFQGLCLVDWGRGIDLNLFPSPTEFHGDCGTSGFRCIEMQEHRNWTYQVRSLYFHQLLRSLNAAIWFWYSALPVGRHIQPLRRCAHDATRGMHERREGAQDWWRLRIPT